MKNLFQRYKSDEKFRYRVNLYGGAATNLIFVIIQLYGGIKYQSVWFTALAIYYAVLSVVKFYIGHSINKTGQAGWASFRIVGFIMTILNLALVVMISTMISNPSIAIHQYSIAITAIIMLWTLGSVGVTIYEIVKTRQKNNPLTLASRLVQLIASVVSVLMLQTAIIASVTSDQIIAAQNTIEQFNSLAHLPPEVLELSIESFQELATSNIITGTIVAIFVISTTLYMIIKGTIEKKKYINKQNKT